MRGFIQRAGYPGTRFLFFRLLLVLTTTFCLAGKQSISASAQVSDGFRWSGRHAPGLTTALLPAGGYGLDLGSGSAYVAFTDISAKLNLAQFTIETWFNRTGPGIPATTGSAGIPNAIPLLTHGADQGNNSTTDENWLLVIDDTTDVLAADFEDRSTGTNHPVFGVTPISLNTWHHAAATYNGVTWRLYLDGSLEASMDVYLAPRYDTAQKAGLGAMLNSSGAAQGHFQGVLDEARVWNIARTQNQIIADMNHQLTSGAGLVARWGFGEGSGITLGDSIASPASANGMITGSGFSWVEGAPLNLAVNHAPNPPILVSPADGASGIPASTVLNVNVADPDSDTLTVVFYGRSIPAGNPADFSLVAIPDTQIYTTNQNWIGNFYAQLQWAADQHNAENIRFVTHLGDITEQKSISELDRETEWVRADTAMSRLEFATPDPSDDVPFSLSIGAHDLLSGGGLRFENHFGVSRFSGRSYYGGHYGTDNQNSYSLFSAGSLRFIVLNLACADAAPTSAVLTWADALLKADTSRRGIAVCHALFDPLNPNQFSPDGLTVFNALKGNPNLFLMLGGHVRGEQYRQDSYNGHTIYSLLSDYQDRPNGGDGWLRILQFQPGSNQIQVKTYSPSRNQYEIDTDSLFALPYDMGGNSFEAIGIQTGIPSGSSVSLPWQNLATGTTYEWYVALSDGKTTTVGPTWSFTTGSAGSAPVVTTHPASQTATEGSQAVFTAAASGTPAPTVQWQVNPGSGWTNISGAASTTLAFTAQSSDNGHQYRAVFTNPYGSAISNAATLTVLPANHPPVAQNQSVSTAEEVAKVITLVATDADGDPLTYSMVTPPVHGTLNGAAPNITYTPALNYNGADSFTFKANDGISDSNLATVSISINPVNDPPLAASDRYTTAGDQVLVVAAPGVLANDSDVDGDLLTAGLSTGPAHGSLVFSSNGSFTYTPATGFSGSDGFSYTASDGKGGSDTATVAITVNATNHAPVAQNQSVVMDEDASKAIVLAATDMDGDPLTYTIVTGPIHGSFNGAAPNVTYIPAANYNGSDSFTFKANDGSLDSNIATVSITVAPVNDPPVASGQSISIEAGTPVNISLRATDIDNDRLTYSIVTQPYRGSLSGTAPNLTYTPSAGYSGADSFSFTANDGSADSNIATVSITITGDLIFADDFESGASAWSGTYGQVGFSSPPIPNGSTSSMMINIVSNAPAYIIDQSPSAESRYSVRFYLYPGTIKIAKSDLLTVFSANNAAGSPVATVQVRQSNGIYQARLGILADNRRWTYTPWHPLINSWNSIELSWLAAETANAHNGGITFWLNGTQKANLSGIDNDGQRIESAYLGAVSKPASGTRGAFYFDEFESRRFSYIGP